MDQTTWISDEAVSGQIDMFDVSRFKTSPDVVLVEVSPTTKPKQATLAADSGPNIKQSGTGVAAKLVVIDKDK